MSVLVFVEHHGGELQKGSLGVLAKAATLGEVDAILVGGGVRALATELGSFGAAKVHVADDGALEPPLPQARVDVIAQVVRDGGYDTVLFANSVLAADVAAGLSARLDAGLNWDLVDVELRDGDLVAKRPALQDSVLVEVGWRATPRLALFRAGSFDAVAGSGGEPQVEDVSTAYEQHSQAAKIVSQEQEASSGPSIEDADVIVAGGRGLGAPESFSLAEELARALGISGAIQHKVGMQSSSVIVAINKDPNAPIFEFSDLGVVGDVHEIVPKLTELVNQRKT